MTVGTEDHPLPKKPSKSDRLDKLEWAVKNLGEAAKNEDGDLRKMISYLDDRIRDLLARQNDANMRLSNRLSNLEERLNRIKPEEVIVSGPPVTPAAKTIMDDFKVRIQWELNHSRSRLITEGGWSSITAKAMLKAALREFIDEGRS